MSIKLSLTSTDPLGVAADVLILGVLEGASTKDGVLGELSRALGPAFAKALKREEFTGKKDQTLDVQTNEAAGVKAGRVYLLGLGKRDALTDIDVRLLAATNRDPEKAVREGKLREDLYYRLNVFPIELPALRERGDDIDLLAIHFLDLYNQREGTNKRWSDAALRHLRLHHWPGNVRELRNVVERAAIMSGDVLESPGIQTTGKVVTTPENGALTTVSASC